MLDSNFWNQRYLDSETQWDISYPSPPIVKYIDQLSDKSISILIPGCGNAYEGEFLWRSGFKNVTLTDFAPLSKENFLGRVPDFPKDQFVVRDFFELNGQFDLIIEQTFFCALDPALRPAYAKKMSELLKPNGKLIGVLFNDPLNDDHPPFGGSALEYLGYFQPHFKEIYIQKCVNSIEPRLGRELFIKLSCPLKCS